MRFVLACTELYEQKHRDSSQVVMKDRVSDKPRGFGFVTFVDENVADKVCEEKHELQGRQVRPQML